MTIMIERRNKRGSMMNKEKVVHSLKRILKTVLKWLSILLAITFTVLVFVVVYLLVAQYFYDGDTLGLGQSATFS